MPDHELVIHNKLVLKKRYKSGETIVAYGDGKKCLIAVVQKEICPEDNLVVDWKNGDVYDPYARQLGIGQRKGVIIQCDDYMAHEMADKEDQNSESNNQISNYVMTKVYSGLDPARSYNVGDIVVTYVHGEQVLLVATHPSTPADRSPDFGEMEHLDVFTRIETRSFSVITIDRGKWKSDTVYTCDLLHGTIDKVTYENIPYLCMQTHRSDDHDFYEDFGDYRWKMDVDSMRGGK